MIREIEATEIKSLVSSAIEHHGKHQDALISILTEVNDHYGYIPPEAFREIRIQLNIADGGIHTSESHLFGLASFYQMLSTTPVGSHVIRFCESAPCHVMGGRQLFQAVKDYLKIEPGETSPDGQWTLITTSCLGTCGVGPVMLVDDDIYGNVTPDQITEIFSRYA